MKLLRLAMSNFRSFADCELDLNVDGLVAVVGDNGAGKSSLFLAVEWALYGERRGQGGTRVRRDGCPEHVDCWVEVDFEVGGLPYGVRRVHGKNAAMTRLDTAETVCTGRDEVSRTIAATLGLTHEMFCATFYARQREIQALSDSGKSSERRQQFERLLGIEQLRRAVDLATRDARERKHVVEALSVSAPDVDVIEAELQEIEAQAIQTADVKVAEAAVAEEKARSETATQDREKLLARQRTHGERRVAAEQAHSVLAREQAILEGLEAQVVASRQAAETLAILEPVAGELATLSARERELDLLRQNHERAAALREHQRKAMQTAAGLSDRLAAVLPSADDPQALALAATEAAEELQRVTDDLRQASAARSNADAEVQAAARTVEALRRAVEIEERVSELGDAAERAERGRERWHQLRARRGEVEHALAHDTEHRDAILRDGATASCPACKRPYEGQWEEILAAYEKDICAHTSELQSIDRKLSDLDAKADEEKSRAEEVTDLRAERRSLGELPRAEEVRARAAGAEAALAVAGEREQELARRRAQLEAHLPEVRQRAERATNAAAARSELQSLQVQAVREVELYSEQLEAVGPNGYRPEAHDEVKSELAKAREASQECAGLRSSVQALPLIERRLAQQEEAVAAAQSDVDQLRAAEAEVAVSVEELDAARERSERATAALEDGQRRLEEVRRTALLNDQAVQMARQHLREAKEDLRRLRQARREVQQYEEIAAALSAYREHASRRARPEIEAQTSLLLGQVTDGRYPQVALSDGYLLEIAEQGEFHPLRRFSGGEQDLASLCLRLSLSQTLAIQRGVETGFVILDEVFGSQDPRRRRSLLAQLRGLREARFRQVFVIAHTGDVQAHCDLRIDVGRQGEVSVAEGPRA